jgi:glycosyltransferase involved in cell wall biosynthesis
MPVSVIEAMALGMPVVSTNVGGLSYLLQNKQTAM